MNLPRTRSVPPPWLAPVHDRRVIDRQWLVMAALLLAWGSLFFGYWAAINVAVAAVVAVLAHLLSGVLRQAVGLGPPREARGHVVVLGMLGGLALPVMSAIWWPAAAGAVVGLAAAWVGRSHVLRVHPVAVLGAVLLLVWLVGQSPLLRDVEMPGGVAVPEMPEVPGMPEVTGEADEPDAGARWSVREWIEHAGEPVEAVLRPTHTLIGDVRHVGDPVRGPLSWLRWEPAGGEAAGRPWLERVVAQEQRQWLAEPGQIQAMLGDGVLPPLEDVLLGAVPGGVGATGVGLLLLVSLYLVYRRLASGVMLVSAWGSAVVALLAMPVMIDADWQVVGLVLWDTGPAVGLTWLAYALLGTSLVWCIAMLAPMGMPMGWRGRVVYGVLVGAGGVAALWWIGEPWAAYLGVLAAGLVARPLDGIR